MCMNSRPSCAQRLVPRKILKNQLFRQCASRRACPPRRFKNNYFTEMCSGSEAGSYVRLIDFCSTQL